MRPEDLPESRSPVGQSPRWITVYTFVGLGIAVVLIGLYALPDGARPAVRWLQAIVPVVVLAVYARAYAARRRTMTDVEIGYLRFSIILLTLPGIPGAVPLTLIAGPAFLIWTVVEKRRRRA